MPMSGGNAPPPNARPVACTPCGLALPELKPDCPRTRSGKIGPACVNGFGKRRMRLFPESATYTFPPPSMAIPDGAFKLTAFAACASVVKRSGWPRTISAFAPVCNWFAYFQPSTRLFKVSTT